MPAVITVTGADADGDVLQLTIDGGPIVAGVTVRLDGARERVRGRVNRDGTLEFPLLIDRWGEQGLALPSGEYRLELRDARDVALPTAARLPEPVVRRTDRYRAVVSSDSAGLLLTVSAPLSGRERSSSGQRALRTRHLLARGPLESAVYFESFYGRTVGDNPAALDRVLARTHPHLTRYWSVADRSVPVPSGAVPIVEFSEAWWRVRADARLLVVNDWLRWTYRPRRGQRVLQTWHGTMLKRLALDRPDRSARERAATLLQSRQWDAVLAQNDYSAEHLRTSYGYRGPIWVTGYPRNDRLFDPARSAVVRARLGLADDARTVLYVPTWRDDRDGLVDHLDPAAFAASLPAGTVLLVRGHSRTLGHGRDVAGERVIDVTTYPDIADLLVTADVLVTDYSSVMFDFAAIGKPMIFYVPDLDHYAEVLRGFYFDYVPVAPGPVVRTVPDLLAALSSVTDGDGYAAEFGERYAAWRERFTPLDDGGSAERVVRRLAAAGWLS